MTFPLFYQSKIRKNAIIRKNSTICIEGFQRCGNTFFHFAFKRWNREAKTAHHLHASAHVLKAIEMGIPTIVLIRRPLEAVSSLLIKDLDLNIENALTSYIDFYNKLNSHRNDFVIGRFEEVIDQPGELVMKINEKFGANFNYEILTENKKNNYKIQIQKANARKTETASWERSSVPSAEKEAAKAKISASIASHLLYKEACEVHENFVRTNK